MQDVVKELLTNQYEATLCTLGKCIEACPEASWHQPVANLKFCQAAFHTLFFMDYYLGENHDALKDQAFHRTHEEFFRDYEEMEPRVQVLLYKRDDIWEYLEFCREKARKNHWARNDRSASGTVWVPPEDLQPSRTACLQPPAHSTSHRPLESSLADRWDGGRAVDRFWLARLTNDSDYAG
ncbi:hypothetical protein [Blastopirellula marina]|uniref:Uncharacterized protein n=1 Tax=Blastopirellula marina TaxID=124 RepID=A0A2S8GQ17_9BACT|nr:hypothetical protein [Blastopirellula marina]PQO46104.1 hypothetical protein C5Y93_11045 [Blastopirellula marina]